MGCQSILFFAPKSELRGFAPIGMLEMGFERMG
jgi:hypothetical protein